MAFLELYSQILRRVLEGWHGRLETPFQDAKALYKGRMLQWDVSYKNGVSWLLLAALYLRKCRVVETFRIVWEVGRGGLPRGSEVQRCFFG